MFSKEIDLSENLKFIILERGELNTASIKNDQTEVCKVWFSVNLGKIQFIEKSKAILHALMLIDVLKFKEQNILEKLK